MSGSFVNMSASNLNVHAQKCLKYSPIPTYMFMCILRPFCGCVELKYGYIRLCCEYVWLFCEYVGLFCEYVGLFCEYAGLFCEYVGRFCGRVGLSLFK